MLDDCYANSAGGKLKLGASLEIGDPDGTRLFKGTVTSVEIESLVDRAPELVIVAYDQAIRLTQNTRTRAFLQMSEADIIRKLATDAGLAAPKLSIDASVQPYVLQADTDLELLQTLVDRMGAEWWMDGDTLTVASPKTTGAPVSMALGKDIGDLTVRASALAATAVEVRGWDRENQQPIRATATSGKAPAPASKLADSVRGRPTTTVIDASATPMTSHEASLIARSAYDRDVTSAVEAHGTCLVDPRIAPGGAIQLTDAGPASGTYPVTSVEHAYGADGFWTRFVCGARRPMSIVDTLRAAPDGSGLRNGGLVVGTVTNINDPEKRGRVRVKYGGLSDDVESAWARLVTLGAGKSRGLVFLPEIGDEVLVGFEGADARQPVVIGGMFGPKTTIPNWQVDQGTVAARRITSRLGHVVELSDGTTPATQHVLIQLADPKHAFRLGKDNASLAVPAGVPIEITSGQAKITIAKDGSISVKGMKIQLTADAELAMSAPIVKITAKASLALEGAVTSVKASGAATVEGTGSLMLKGGQVMIN
jgi:phage protein D